MACDRLLLRLMPSSPRTSSKSSPMLHTGSSVMGSWNTIAIFDPLMDRHWELDIPALEILDSNAALDQREPRGQKTNGRQSRHGLATARLSHKRHHLSGTDLQTGTTDNRVAVRDGLYLDRVES